MDRIDDDSYIRPADLYGGKAPLQARIIDIEDDIIYLHHQIAQIPGVSAIFPPLQPALELVVPSASAVVQAPLPSASASAVVQAPLPSASAVVQAPLLSVAELRQNLASLPAAEPFIIQLSEKNKELDRLKSYFLKENILDNLELVVSKVKESMVPFYTMQNDIRLWLMGTDEYKIANDAAKLSRDWENIDTNSTIGQNVKQKDKLALLEMFKGQVEDTIEGDQYLRNISRHRSIHDVVIPKKKNP